ncbi:MAG: autotransporter outer membrane beta-barrel domain-containing protein, partial [Rickettsiales bacterium]|nr:autotransporter outer membrane beta-barrel domain-containing protein [Rickettsiales bacterium]
ILAGTIALVGEATILKNTKMPLDLLFSLAYSRNSYTLDRNIEKIDNKTVSSKFSSNVFSIAVDLEKKFSLSDIVTLRTSLGLHSSILTMSSFQENNEDYLALHLEQKTQQLTSINLGLGIAADLAQYKLTPRLSIGGLFPVSAGTPEMTASLKDYPDNKFTTKGTSYKNSSFSLYLGLDYKFSAKLLLSTNLNYITNSSYKSFDLGLGLGMKI